jgi:hypothetical protein
MAITDKLDGLLILSEFGELFRVICREKHERGDDWPFFKVHNVYTDSDCCANETYLRNGTIYKEKSSVKSSKKEPIVTVNIFD